MHAQWQFSDAQHIFLLLYLFADIFELVHPSKINDIISNNHLYPIYSPIRVFIMHLSSFFVVVNFANLSLSLDAKASIRALKSHQEELEGRGCGLMNPLVKPYSEKET